MYRTTESSTDGFELWKGDGDMYLGAVFKNKIGLWFFEASPDIVHTREDLEFVVEKLKEFEAEE